MIVVPSAKEAATPAPDIRRSSRARARAHLDAAQFRGAHPKPRHRLAGITADFVFLDGAPISRSVVNSPVRNDWS